MRFIKYILCLMVIIASQGLDANDDCIPALSNEARELALAIVNNDRNKLSKAIFTTDRQKANRYLYFKSDHDSFSVEDLLDSVTYYYPTDGLDGHKTITPLGLAIKVGVDVEIIETLLRHSGTDIFQPISLSENKNVVELVIEEGRVDYLKKFVEYRRDEIFRLNPSSSIRLAIEAVISNL